MYSRVKPILQNKNCNMNQLPQRLVPQQHPHQASKPGSQQAAAFRRKRKFLMVLPPMILLPAFLLFKALGGGQGTIIANGKDSTARGFNANLPGAQFSRKDKPLDKWQAYQKADADSAKRREYGQQDPYQSATTTSSSAAPG